MSYKKEFVNAEIPIGRESTHFNVKPLAGKRFGKLLVLWDSGIRNHREVYWECLCNCGKTVIKMGSSLRANKTFSCGCSRNSLEARKNRVDNHVRVIGAAANLVFRGYIEAAKERNLKFTISKEKFLELTGAKCFYCGCAPFSKRKSRFEEFIFNGLDRVDNEKGYSIDNVVTCCQTCNYMKHAMTKEEFLRKVRDIFLFQEAQNS